MTTSGLSSTMEPWHGGGFRPCSTMYAGDGDKGNMGKGFGKGFKPLIYKWNREMWIAGIFVLFIICVPVFTVISGMFPQSGKDADDKGKNVLEGNGTLNSSEGIQIGDGGGNGRNDAGKAQGGQDWFRALQGVIGDFTERLYLKDELITVNRELVRLMTGDDYIESTQVLLGKNHWLFYKTELDGNPLLDYKGTNHFTEEELGAMGDNLTAMRDYFEGEKGIRFLVMGLPNKENLYAEYMPDTIPKLVEQSRADQVAEYLWNHTDIDYIYPKEELGKEKETNQVYYTTDTHWNQIGAFVGLQAFFSRAYGTWAATDSVEFLVTDTNFAGDLATIAGITEDYSIDTAYVLNINSVSPEQYRDEVLLVVGDSFSGFLAIVAEPYYKKVYRVEPEKFTMSMLDQYQIDVVLWESVERRIEIFKNTNLLEQ